MVNYRLLEGGTVQLLTGIIERESAMLGFDRSSTKTPAIPCSVTW